MMNTNTYMINDTELEAVNGGGAYSNTFVITDYKNFDDPFGFEVESADE